MEDIKLNEGIKDVLRAYSVGDDVIKLIEEDQNVKVQAVANFYEEQLQEVQKEETDQKKADVEYPQAEFMERLNKHRIVKK